MGPSLFLPPAPRALASTASPLCHSIPALSLSLPVCLFGRPGLLVCVSLPVSLSVRLCVSLYVSLRVHLPVCVSVRLSTCIYAVSLCLE